MRLHRFYVREKLEVGREVVIPDSDLTHQLKRVFRLKVGNVIVLFDGDGFEYVSQILSFEDNAITFRINEAKGSLELPKVKVCLYPSLIKKDNLEWVIQKCTELGVAEFHPVISERSEKKSFDMLRAEKIAIEAAEQSGWERIPKIYEP
ncbi:MAG TPA: RsmE family RNA methyltransferase, partial [Candidatus Paceibacterota bacterium]|nr:RsmE family RNA methyltransferase [Candidatus Paceibacterota bacterium]